MHDDDPNADLREPARTHDELVEQVATLAFHDTATPKDARTAAVWILNQVRMALRLRTTSYVVSQGTPTERTVRVVEVERIEGLLMVEGEHKACPDVADGKAKRRD